MTATRLPDPDPGTGTGTGVGPGVDPGPDVAAAVLAATARSSTALLVCRPVEPGSPTTDFEVVHENAASRAQLPVGSLLGRRLHEVFPAQAGRSGDLHPLYREALATGTTRSGRVRLASPGHPAVDEHDFEVEACGADGLLVLLFHDVTAREHARQALAAGERRYRALVEHATDVVAVFDAAGRTTYVSPSFERILGHPAGSATGRHYRDLVVPDQHPTADGAFATVLAAGPETVTTVELQVLTATGEPRWIEAQLSNRLDEPSVAGVLANWRDVTEHRALERRLAHEALHDPLTGLPNRQFLDELLTRAIARTHRADHASALLFCDVDHFGVVNDSLGHDAGDALIRDVAQRLRGALRPSDVVTRFGGDEFVVLCEDLENESDALTVAERLQHALHGDYHLHGRAAAVTTSMGVTVLHPGSTAPDALSEADAALFEAKRAGRARVEAFTPRMRQQWRHRLDTEASLRRALAGDELCLHYQPIIDLRDGRTSHVEALLRWQQPDGRLVQPGEFLPVAEETGLIVEIGRWVLRTGFEQAARWQRQVPGAPRVSLNVAGRQLHEAGFAGDVEDLLAELGPAADGIELEVSERLLAHDQPALVRTLHRLRESGVHVSLDDFGAGQTAIAWLQQLPFDTLKLDRSLVVGLPAEGASAVVHALAQLSRRLDIRSIAEGVETRAQLEAVTGLGCAHAQGFLLGRPMPAGELETLLTTGGAAAHSPG
ncbi:EAL domain-containing protein [Kineococcus sp. NUM-3379]